MTSIRCHRFGRSLSIGLIGALLVTMLIPPGAVITKRAAAQPGVKTVLAFPAVDESEGGKLTEVAARVTSALALAGRDFREVDLEIFSDTSPMVRRALADGSLRPVDIEGPKDAVGALMIGQALRMTSVVLVSIQSLKLSGTPRTAELSVMGTEYAVAANVEATTGTIVAQPTGNTFGVSGTAKSRDVRGGDDESLTRLAAKAAAYNIMHVLAGRTAQEYVERGAEPKKRSNLWRWIAIAIAAGGIAWATAGSRKSGTGVPADETIPTRRSARPTTDGIQLTWAPPTTFRIIFKYQLHRSANGGIFTDLDNDKLGPDATSFRDFTTDAGTAYVYEIRVLFTDGGSSPWVVFNQVVAP